MEANGANMILTGISAAGAVMLSILTCWAVYSLTCWITGRRTQDLVRMAFALVPALAAGFDVIPFAVVLAVVIALLQISGPGEQERRKSGLQEWRKSGLQERRKSGLQEWKGSIEAAWLILLTPVLYLFAVWFVYWHFSGRDIFIPVHSFLLDISSIVPADCPSYAVLLSGKASIFLAPYGFILIKRLVTGKLFRMDQLVLFLLLLSTQIYPFFLMFEGRGLQWSGSPLMLLAITVAWLPYEFKATSG